MANHRRPRTADDGARKTVKDTKRRRGKSPREADAITTSLRAGGIALGDVIGEILDLDLVVGAEVEVGAEAEATIATIGRTLEATILLVMTATTGLVIGTVTDMVTLTEAGIVVIRDIDGTMMMIETTGRREVVTEGVTIRPHAANGGKRISIRLNQNWNTTTDPKRLRATDSREATPQIRTIEILVPIETSSERKGRNNKTYETKTCKSEGRENE